MKRERLYLTLIAAAAVLVMALPGCGKKPVETDDPGGDVSGVTDVTEGTQQSAIREALLAEDTATVEIPEGVSFASPLTVNGEKTITGGTITVDGTAESMFIVSKGASLTLDGAVLDGAGKAKVGVMVEEGGTFLFASGSIEDTAKQALRAEGTVTITGGSFSNCGSNWIYLAEGAEVSISGGNFDTSKDVGLNALSGSKIAISGGVFANAGSSTLFNRGEAKVTGGLFMNSGNYAVSNEGTAEISNLEISNSLERGDVYNFAVGTLTMTDCNLHDSAGYSLYNNGKATLTNVAMKTTANSAINNQTRDAELTLVGCSISEAGSNGIYNKDAVLTIQDVNITDSGNHAVYNRAGDITAVNLTMKNAAGTVLCNDSLADGEAVYGSISVDGFVISGAQAKGVTCYGGVLNLKNGTVDVCGDQNIYVKDGTSDMTAVTVKGSENHSAVAVAIGLNGFESAVVRMTDVNISGGARGISNHGTLTLNSGVISGNRNNGDLNYGGGVYNFNTFVMNGGTITGNTSVSGGAGLMNSGSAYLYGGTISGNASSAQGGGVYNGSKGTAYLSGITVENNTSGNEKGGGGIYNLGTMTIDGKTAVRGNKSDDSGAGIMNSTSADGTSMGKLTIKNVTVSGNQAVGSGGGVFSSGTLVIQNGTFTQNTAGEEKYGGGVYSSGDLTVTGGSFTYNTAPASGGGIFVTGPNNSIENALIEWNTAGNNGGGVSCSDPVTIGASTVIRNNTAGNNGGGIYCSAASAANVSGVTLENNTAGNHGGGVYNLGTMTIAGNTSISGNQAAGSGAGIMNSTSTDGTSAGKLTIKDVTVSGNQAVGSGGGVYSSGSLIIQSGTFTQNTAGAEKYGGGVYSSGDLTVTGGSFTYNTAPASGGGIFVTGPNNSIENALIEWNTAGNNGGGVSCSDPVTIGASTVIRNNTAGNNGGGLYCSKTADISGATVENNTAGNNGGGIYCSGTSQLTDVTVQNNIAKVNGGGVVLTGASSVSGGSVIRSNTAENNGGGLYCSNAAVVDGASIVKNAAGNNGGNVYITSSGALTARGMEISDGSAANRAGGVYIYRGSAVLDHVTMTDNAATGNGIGIYNSSGSLEIIGGSYTRGTNGGEGYIVHSYIDSSEVTPVYKLSGQVEIESIYLAADVSLQLTRALEYGSSIAVRLNSVRGIGSRAILTGSGEDVSDAAQYVSILNVGSGCTYVVEEDGTGKSVLPGGGSGGSSGGGSGSEVTPETVAVIRGGKVVYAGTLTNAISKARDGDILELRSNVTATSKVTVDKNLTIQSAGAYTIYLNATTYTGMEISTDLTIKGTSENPITITRSAGASKYRAISVEADGGALVMEYVTVKNLTNNTNNAGGINVAGSLTATSCTFTNCNVTAAEKNGGAVYVSTGGTLILRDSVVENCSSANYGGAIYCLGTATVNNTEITGCSALTGGAVYVTSAGDLTVEGGEISGNTASTGSGGGIYNYKGKTTLNDAAVTDNVNTDTSKNGTGVYNYAGTLAISGGTYANASGYSQYVVHNYSTTDTQAQCFLSGAPSVESLYLATNVSIQLTGALGEETGIALRLGDCTEGRMVLTGDEAAVAASNDYFTILNRDAELGMDYSINDYGKLVTEAETRLVRNGEQVLLGSLAKMVENAESGDTIVLLKDVTVSSKITVDKQVTVRGEDPGKEYTIYLDVSKGYSLDFGAGSGGSKIDGTSGKITLTTSNGSNEYVAMAVRSALTLDSVTIKDLVNTKTDGNTTGLKSGVFNIISTGDLTLTSCTVENCSSAYHGGVAYVAGKLTVTNSTISGSQAGSSGGAVYCTGTAALTNVTAAGNTAEGNGGVVYVASSGSLTVEGGSFTGNTADYGGDIYNYRGTLSFQESPEVEEVYLASESLISLTEALGGNADIGVKLGSSDCKSGRQVLTAEDGTGYVSGSYDRFTILNSSGVYTPYGLNSGGKIVSYTVAVEHQDGSAVSYHTGFTTAKNAETTAAGDTLVLLKDVTLGAANTLNKSLTITDDGEARTIYLDCETDYTLKVTANITIEGTEGGGITLTRSEETTSTNPAIQINDAGCELTLKNVTVTGFTSASSSAFGGAIYAAKGTLNVIDSTLSNCVSGKNGGAVYVGSGGTLTMSNSAISGNTASTGSGGGIYLYRGSAVLTNVTMTDNSSSGNGVGIYNSSGTLTINGGSYTCGESASTGYIVYSYKDSSNKVPIYKMSGAVEIESIYLAPDAAIELTGELDDAVIGVRVNSTNDRVVLTEAENAGLIAQYHDKFTVLNDGNWYVGHEGKIIARPEAKLVRDGSTVKEGTFAELLTGEDTENGDTIVLLGSVTLNSKTTASKAVTVTDDGTARTMNLDVTNGYTLVVEAEVTIEGTENGGITLTRSEETTSTNPAIQINDAGCELTLKNVTVTGFTNTKTRETYGGAIYAYQGTLNVIDSTISDCKTGYRGGAVYVGSGGTLTMSNSTISGNTATGSGGGIYLYRGSAVLTNVTMTDNSGSGNGVGIYNSSGTLTINGGSYTCGESASTGYIVYSYKDSSNKVPIYKMSGAVEIESIYLAPDAAIELTGELDDAVIGVRVNSTDDRVVLTEAGNAGLIAQYHDKFTVLNVDEDTGMTYAVDEEGKLVEDPEAQLASGSGGDGTAAAGSFAKLVEMAKGGTITLMKDVSLTEDMTVSASVTITDNGAARILDLNGYQLTVSSDCDVSIESSGADGSLTVTDGVNEGKGISVSGKLTVSGDVLVTGIHKASGNGGAFEVQNDGELVLRGSVFVTDCSAVNGSGAAVYNAGTLTIENGDDQRLTITAQDDADSAGTCAIYNVGTMDLAGYISLQSVYSAGTVRLSGGLDEAWIGVWMDSPEEGGIVVDLNGYSTGGSTVTVLHPEGWEIDENGQCVKAEAAEAVDVLAAEAEAAPAVDEAAGTDQTDVTQTDGIETDQTDQTDGTETDQTDGIETDQTDQTDGIETDQMDQTDGIETDQMDQTDVIQTDQTAPDPADGTGTENNSGTGPETDNSAPQEEDKAPVSTEPETGEEQKAEDKTGDGGAGEAGNTGGEAAGNGASEAAEAV